MKVIWACEGGGYKGVISSTFGMMFERELRRYNRTMLDAVHLFSGCSTGALQVGQLAAGVPYSSILDMYVTRVNELFVTNWQPWKPKYKKDPILTRFRENLRKYQAPDDMQRTKALLQINAVDEGYNEGNVYFKSWKPKCVQPISRCCEYSFSAPYYFGATVETNYGQPTVYLDGGTGNGNCTLLECIIEAQKLGWLGKEQVLIINVGTGQRKCAANFATAKSLAEGLFQNFRSVTTYLNLARRQAKATQLAVADMIQTIHPNFMYIDVDTTIPDDLDEMAKTDATNQYYNIGAQLAQQYIPKILSVLQL